MSDSVSILRFRHSKLTLAHQCSRAHSMLFSAASAAVFGQRPFCGPSEFLPRSLHLKSWIVRFTHRIQSDCGQREKRRRLNDGQEHSISALAIAMVAGKVRVTEQCLAAVLQFVANISLTFATWIRHWSCPPASDAPASRHKHKNDDMSYSMTFAFLCSLGLAVRCRSPLRDQLIIRNVDFGCVLQYALDRAHTTCKLEVADVHRHEKTTTGMHAISLSAASVRRSRFPT